MGGSDGRILGRVFVSLATRLRWLCGNGFAVVLVMEVSDEAGVFFVFAIFGKFSALSLMLHVVISAELTGRGSIFGSDQTELLLSSLCELISLLSVKTAIKHRR